MSKTLEIIQQAEVLLPLGFTPREIEKLMRHANTLHRWDEAKCNGEVEVDDDGTAFNVYGSRGGEATTYKVKTRNREASTWNKVQNIVAAKEFKAERQGDPRGAPYYIVGGSKRIAVLWI